MGTMTHLTQLTRGPRGQEIRKFLLTWGGDPDHRRHAQEEGGRMTPTLPPFVRPCSLHAPTFCRMLCGLSIFYRI